MQTEEDVQGLAINEDEEEFKESEDEEEFEDLPEEIQGGSKAESRTQLRAQAFSQVP